jgi:methyl coenzyme M reductase subunit D
MPTPASNQNQRKNSGVYFGPTRGRAIPHNKRRACLCKDSDTYSMDCCNGALIGQSIGNTQAPEIRRGAFSDGFSDGFDIGNI